MVNEKQIHPLRSWRIAEGKTQDWCAAQVGTTRQVWSDWERARRVPNRFFMPRVLGLANGKISADDFYPQISQALQDAA